MLFAPLLQRFLIDGDNGGNERALLADDHALGDDAIGADLVLQQRRNHILATRGNDDFLFATGDRQKALVIELTDVPGAEPAIDEGLRGQVIAAKVALHDAHALGEDLAVVRDLHRVAGQRRSHGTDLDPLGAIDGNRRCSFRQAVALKDLQANALIEVA